MKKSLLRTLVALLLIVAISLGMTSALAQEKTPVYGGKLTLVSVNTVFPFWANVTTFPGAYAYTWSCIEPLGYETDNGGYKFLLVKEAVRDNENLTLTLTVHPSIKFHDGSELTAEVLAWNIQTCIDSGVGKSIGDPMSVEVVGDYSVKLQYKSFSLFWEKLICKVYAYSKLAYDTYGEQYMQTNPVGTGPFYFVEHKIETSILFNRFDDYWGERAYLDAIEYILISDTTAFVSAFINEQCHEIDTSDKEVVESIEKAGYTHMDIFDYGSVNYIMFNSTLPDSPWFNKDVRRAVCLYGVDWDGITYALRGDFGLHFNTTAVPASNHWLDPEEWKLDIGYDRERALQMLKDAGYGDGFITTLYCSANDSRMATLIQAAFADLNINLNVEFVTNTADWRESGKTDGLIIGGEFSYLDWSSRVTDYYSETGLYKKVLGFSQDYKDAYAKLIGAATMDEAVAQLKQLNYIIHYNDCYMFPVCYTPVRFYSQSYSHGWEEAKRYPASFNAEMLWLEQ